MTAWKCLGRICSSVGDFRSGTDELAPDFARLWIQAKIYHDSCK